MKFFTPILSLFTASLVYSAATNNDKLIQNCKSELKEYSTCIFDYKKISVSELDSYCNTYKSSKCQKFINSPNTYVPSCYSLPDSVRVEDIVLLNYKRDLMNMICQKDEKGKKCAYSDIFFNEDKVSNVSYVKGIIEKTCDSNTCASTYKNLLEAQISVGKEKLDVKYGLPKTDVNSLQEMLKYINSKKCLNNNANPTTTTKKKTSTSVSGKPTSTVSGRCGPEYGACAKSNYCCSKYGYCGTSSSHCGDGCQSEFGICSTTNNINKTVTKKSTTTKTTTPKKSSTTTSKKQVTTSNKKPTSTVSGRCGPEYGACAKSNYCCSKYGYCGTSEDHCGNGCQSEFGICNKSNNVTTTKKSTTTSSKKKTTTTTTKKVSSTKKSNTTSKKATTTKKSTTTKKASSTKKSIATVSGRCGAEYGGACAKNNYCCSKYNYCGTSEDHCGTGCQPAYGICH